MDKITTLGRIFIAIALVVFWGSALYLLALFVAGLVPAWMPGAAILGVLCGRGVLLPLLPVSSTKDWRDRRQPY